MVYFNTYTAYAIFTYIYILVFKKRERGGGVKVTPFTGLVVTQRGVEV